MTRNDILLESGDVRGDSTTDPYTLRVETQQATPAGGCAQGMFVPARSCQAGILFSIKPQLAVDATPIG